MNLDLFKDLIKSTKENDIVQSFIKELGDCLKNNLNNNERNQIPLVQKILDGRILSESILLVSLKTFIGLIFPDMEYRYTL